MSEVMTIIFVAEAQLVQGDPAKAPEGTFLLLQPDRSWRPLTGAELQALHQSQPNLIKGLQRGRASDREFSE